MRTIMTLLEAFHPGDNIEGCYVSRKERERGLTRIEDATIL